MVVQRIPLSLVKPGMVAARSVYSAEGLLLLAEGMIFTERYIKRLWDIGIMSVYIQNPLLQGITAPEIIREETRVKAVQTVQRAFENFRINKKLEIQQFRNLTKFIIDEVVQNRNAMIHLSDVRTHDDYTFGHSVNVCMISTIIGIALGYNQINLQELALGALLHDVGKMLIPKEILNKPGKFSTEETKLMQLHCEFGFDILRKQSYDMSLLSIHVAYQHQEKYDGTGYPRGLKGSEIHEYARIAAIADVYDALTADRPYRIAMLPYEAYEIMMASANSHFDVDILKHFLRQVALYPAGTVVQLNTGEIGIVTHVLKDLQTRPIIKLIIDAQENYLANQPDFDLTEHLTAFITRVLTDEEVIQLGLVQARANKKSV